MSTGASTKPETNDGSRHDGNRKNGVSKTIFNKKRNQKKSKQMDSTFCLADVDHQLMNQV